MKKTSPSKTATKKAAGLPHSPYARIHTLLHTIRCIAQYEDALCELSHEVKRSGVLSDEAKVALDGILTRLPAEDYVQDLDAVTVLLEEMQERPASAGKGKVSAAPVGKRASAPKKAVKKSAKSRSGVSRTGRQ